MHERPKDVPPKAAELLFSAHWPLVFLFCGSNLSASCIASFILHSKEKANVLETTDPSQNTAGESAGSDNENNIFSG
jgi:hypothetical protein